MKWQKKIIDREIFPLESFPVPNFYEFFLISTPLVSCCQNEPDFVNQKCCRVFSSLPVKSKHIIIICISATSLQTLFRLQLRKTKVGWSRNMSLMKMRSRFSSVRGIPPMVRAAFAEFVGTYVLIVSVTLIRKTISKR